MSETIVTVRDGQTVVQDPGESLVYHFMWGRLNLQPDVNIASGVMSIRKITPTTGSPVAAVDNDLVLTDGRTHQVRVVSGGDSANGHLYEVTSRIVTDEVPAQTKERSFRIRIQQR